MTTITADAVKELRERTGAGFMDCKRALQEAGGRVGVLIEVNCETDFVARNEDFQRLVRDLAVQVAGLAPRWVAIEDVPDEAVAAKREELAGDARTRDDVEAHVKRWLKEVVLLDQPFRDTNLTVRDLITNAVATIGENIRVRRFIRYALGEEL